MKNNNIIGSLVTHLTIAVLCGICRSLFDAGNWTGFLAPAGQVISGLYC